MYTSFIGIYVGQGQAGHVGKMLGSTAEVVELYEMSGPFDLLAKVNAGTRKDIEALAVSILRLEGVEKTFNMLAMDEKFHAPEKSPENGNGARKIAFLGLRIEAGKESEVERMALSVESVMAAYAMAYPYELFVKISGESERSLSKIAESFARVEGVYAHDMFLGTHRLKP